MDPRRDPIDADDFRIFPRHLDGKARSRHHAEYAGWHRSACWNGRRFERFPEYIVRAQSVADVAHSIDFARRHRLPVSVRGRGHSYAGCFLRDDGLLLDLAALDRIDVDAAARLAAVQPGASSRQLAQALAPHGLAFPTGHGGDVGLSGFLLGGGLGINFRAWGGISAFNVRAIDLIGADGDLLHADAEHHPELFWAARGGGPGLGFVVVKFYLDCRPLPRCITSTCARTGLDRLGELLQAIERADPEPALQVMVAVVPDGDGLQASLSALAFADTPRQAQALHASLFANLPAGLLEPPAQDQPSGFEAIYRQSEAMLVSRRYRSDNILTDRAGEAAHPRRAPARAAVAGDRAVADLARRTATARRGVLGARPLVRLDLRAVGRRTRRRGQPALAQGAVRRIGRRRQRRLHQRVRPGRTLGPGRALLRPGELGAAARTAPPLRSGWRVPRRAHRPALIRAGRCGAAQPRRIDSSTSSPNGTDR
ncbi:FAD-binding oxidoreductase [Lysobacter enzymogenes]|nr:FAD-binding protein [Lysobacter enzymogenes]QCW24852.1 FAD-binding oxidoreductase [Lysobacter enzymogenes]